MPKYINFPGWGPVDVTPRNNKNPLQNDMIETNRSAYRMGATEKLYSRWKLMQRRLDKIDQQDEQSRRLMGVPPAADSEHIAPGSVAPGFPYPGGSGAAPAPYTPPPTSGSSVPTPPAPATDPLLDPFRRVPDGLPPGFPGGAMGSGTAIASASTGAPVAPAVASDAADAAPKKSSDIVVNSVAETVNSAATGFASGLAWMVKAITSLFSGAAHALPKEEPKLAPVDKPPVEAAPVVEGEKLGALPRQFSPAGKPQVGTDQTRYV